MIYDEKAKCLRREDGSLTVHVDEIEDGRIYFDIALKGMTRVSMLEIEEIIALGGRDYAAGRRAGIEDAAKALESNLNVPGTSLQTRLTPWVDQGDCIRASVRQVRSLLEAKT